MAFVVARRDGRFEIRESVATPRGPRARTLATFRELSDEVLDHAQARATTVLDRDLVAVRALELGAPRAPRTTARLGWRLLGELESGHDIPPVLAGALAARLAGVAVATPDTLAPLSDWLGATPQERGEALRDLLRLTDRIPRRPARRGKRFPRIASARP
jgi:hypothetical protein